MLSVKGYWGKKSEVSGQQFKGSYVGKVEVVAGEDAGEDRMAWVQFGEEGDTGAEFQVVGRAEDFTGGKAESAVYAQQRLTAFDETRAEDGMGEIGGGFVEILDRIELGGRATAKTFDLGKNEPHPVTLLAAGTQLTKGRLVYAILCGKES